MDLSIQIYLKCQIKKLRFWATIIGLIFSFSAIATEDVERMTSLIKDVQSYQLSAFEKALFTDASDRFKKYVIPKNIGTNSVFWLDNEHLVISSRKYPGWEAKPEEMSRVISYNILTGTIIDSGYRGIVRCLNHLGEVVITQEDKDIGIPKPKESYTWLAGKWGKDLAIVQPLQNSFIPTYLCRFVSYGTLTKREIPKGLEFTREMTTPLLESHGSIEEFKRSVGNEIEASTQLVKPTGEKILLRNRLLSHFYFTYMPWNNAYFETTATPPEPISFSPDGEVQVHHLPKLLSIWNDLIYRSAAAYPSKKGTLWVKQQGQGFWRKQGIFLQRDSELIRIEEGQALGDPQSSPNGCRIHVRVYRGDPFKRIPSNYLMLVIDVCEDKYE
jgi:hypothetical protein